MSEPLTIKFDADTDSAKAKVAGLVSSIGGSMLQMNAALGGATQEVSRFQAGIEALPAPIRAAVDAFVAFEAVKLVAGRIGAAFEDAGGKIQKMLAIVAGAQRAGVGTTFFQGFVNSASEVGLSADQATAMLNRAREASTTRQGQNGAPNQSALDANLGEQQKAGNLTRGDTAAYRAAADTEAKIRAALDLIEKLDQGGKRLAALDIGKTMFGDDFERKLLNGVDLIGQMRTALNGMTVAGGIRITTPEELAKADEFKKKTEEINKLIGEGMAPIERDILKIQNNMMDNWISMELAVANVVKRIGEMYTKFKKFLDEWGLLPSFLKDGEGGPLVLHVKPKGSPADSTAAKLKKTTDSGNETDAVEDLIRNLQKAREVEQGQLDTLGKSNTERQKAVDLAKGQAAARSDYDKGRRDSAYLDEDETKRILEQAEAAGKVHDAFLNTQQALAQAAEQARYFGTTLSDAISSAIVDGNKLSDVLMSVVKTLEKSAITGLIMGTGPFALNAAPASGGPNALGGLLGMGAGLFGGRTGAAGSGISMSGPLTAAEAFGLPGFAAGGNASPGLAMVGENGPELVRFGAPATVTPNNALGGGGVNIVVNNHAGAQVDTVASPRSGGGFDVNVMVRQMREAMRAEDIRTGQAGPAYRRG